MAYQKSGSSLFTKDVHILPAFGDQAINRSVWDRTITSVEVQGQTYDQGYFKGTAGAWFFNDPLQAKRVIDYFGWGGALLELTKIAATAIGAGSGSGIGALGERAAGLGEARFVNNVKIYTQTNDFTKIINSGRIWGQTEGSVYGMTIREAPWWRTFRNSLIVREPGTIIFQDQAAQLFSPHEVEGLYSGLKRGVGQYKAGFGDIVYDTSTSSISGNTLIIRNAVLDTHSGQSVTKAATRLWARRLGIDLPITAGAGCTGYLLYQYMNDDAH